MKTKTKYQFCFAYDNDCEMEALFINTQECWDQNQHLVDHYTDQQRAELDPILDLIGASELMESTFEYEASTEDARQILLKNGLVESKELKKIVESY